MADLDIPLDPLDLSEVGNLRTVISSAGLVPTPPLSLRQQLVEIVALTNPGFTANLPGTLIEDIASTDAQALVLIDQARVEAINSMTPFGCNEFVLMLLGKVYGVPIGTPNNTSVFVTFAGDAGLVVGKGFVVSDGAYQYIVQDGGIIGANGYSEPLYAVSNTPGSWAVPAGSVTALATPPPTGFSLAVINQLPGIPATSGETATQYRSRVLRAGLAASQGMARYLRTLLGNVPGVDSRLIGIQQKAQVDGGGWMIIVGGGDPYEVAYAIYQALFDITSLTGSTMHVIGITHANPAIVTTDLDHGLVAGQTIQLADVIPGTYDSSYAVLPVPAPTNRSFGLGKPYDNNAITVATWAAGVVTATCFGPHGLTAGSTALIVGFNPPGYNGTVVVTPTSATIFTYPLTSDPGAVIGLGQLAPGIANFDATGLAPYSSAGSITPNPRNLLVSITDYPDSYLINYVVPPQQAIHVVVNWASSSANIVAAAAVAQLGGPAMADYINSIIVGEPINLMQLGDAFQNAIVSVLPPAHLSALSFQVTINGVGTAPDAGTHMIHGDPQSFFYAAPSDFTFVEL